MVLGIAMKQSKLPDDFYERKNRWLQCRIGKELRVAYRILDLGCGACGLAEFLRKTYRQCVTGIDISDTTFPRHDVPEHALKPLRCIKANAAHLDFVMDGKIDAVFSRWAVHEMDDPRGVLKEAFRTLRPGGKILILDFPKDSLAQRLWNEDYYTLQEIEEMLQETGFDDIRTRTIAQGQVIWATGFRPALKLARR